MSLQHPTTTSPSLPVCQGPSPSQLVQAMLHRMVGSKHKKSAADAMADNLDFVNISSNNNHTNDNRHISSTSAKKTTIQQLRFALRKNNLHRELRQPDKLQRGVVALVNRAKHESAELLKGNNNSATDSSARADTGNNTNTNSNEIAATGNNTTGEYRGAKRKREEWTDFEPLDTSDHDDQDPHEQQDTDHPWMRHNYASNRTAMQMFTQELNDFADYLKPTPEEHHIRTYVFKAVKEFLNSLWPGVPVHVFGSFNTKLYLPGSDMDIVVMLDGVKKKNPKTLANKIRGSGFGVNVEAIIFTKVPIVKFRESRTGIPVDISFNQLDGFKTAAVVQKFMEDMPVLQPMVMLIKQFLKCKPATYCQVHQGGLGSFSVTLLVMSFLQMHPRIQARMIDPLENLGVLVIEFFELYGLRFNYRAVSISVAQGGSYISKDDGMAQNQQLNLNLINPVDGQNVAKATRNMSLIQTGFAMAYHDLVTAVRKQQQELDGNTGPVQEHSSPTTASQSMLRQRSMVSKVFQVQEYMVKERNRIHTVFYEGYFQQKFGAPALEQAQPEKVKTMQADQVDRGMPLVGDASGSLDQDEGVLVRAFRRHFPLMTGLRTIKEFTSLFGRNMVKNANASDKSIALLDDAAFQTIQTEIDELGHMMSTARVGPNPNTKDGSGGFNGRRGRKVKSISSETWRQWSLRQAKLQAIITQDKYRMVALVRAEAARLDQDAMDSQKAYLKKRDVVSANEQGACLKVLSQVALSLFEELDPDDPQQVATFQLHYLELMEQQAQFGVREVESREGTILGPEDRAQLVEWSNSAVSDRLRSIDPVKLAKLEEALALLNSQGQGQSKMTTTKTTGSAGNNGMSEPSDDVDVFQVHDSDEDDYMDDGFEEPSDKYFDAMMREAQDEYGSSSEDDNNNSNDSEATASSKVGAHQDPQNINSAGHSIQLSQLYSSPGNDYGIGFAGGNGGNSSRHEQLARMRKQ
ncbi:hypothetical protein BGW39_010494 [Mortierella sp. 14UC]|nr:hypothetical protein BGW39_010494 [Mortierella sp. 14UC]